MSFASGQSHTAEIDVSNTPPREPSRRVTFLEFTPAFGGHGCGQRMLGAR
jgi:hypothetical protein